MLQKLIEKNNLTHLQLAKMSGVRTERIQLWVSGVVPNLEKQILLAKAFSMTLLELQKFCNWPENHDVVLVNHEA
mgnify:CR=1 FL=1